MKIGLRRVMCRKGSVFYEVAVLGNLADIFATQKIRLRCCSRFYRPNPFCLGIKNTALGEVEAGITINSYVTFQFNVVRVGIVLRVIGINICVADMNGDIIPRCRPPVFIRRLPGGGNFNRSILRRLDLSVNQTGARE